ncbi:glycosyltransferase family 4 protein [Profundibacter sp.]
MIDAIHGANRVNQPARRVLFVRNSRGITDITGAETYLLNILSGLAQAGCEVHLVCADILSKGDTPWLAALRNRGIPHTVIDVPGTFSRADFIAVCKMVKSFRPDVIHAMDHRADAVAVWASARTGVPAVASFFGWTNWAKSTLRGRLYPIFDRLVMRRLKKVIVDSAYVGEQIRSAAPNTHVAVIQNGVDLGRFDVTRVKGGFKSEWFGDENIWLVGLIGRLHPNKGLMDMIEAAAQLLQAHPQMRFVVLGDPPPGYEAYSKGLHARLSQLGIADRFLITNIDSSKIPSAIASFDVTVIASYMESLSYVLLESMAMKTPVISARVGGHGALIQNGQSGFLFDSGDVPQLCSLVSKLAKDSALAASIGTAGYEIVKSGYSTQAMIARTCAVYDEVTQ